MTNWRSLPVLHCEVDQPEKGEVSGGLKRIVFVLNLALVGLTWLNHFFASYLKIR